MKTRGFLDRAGHGRAQPRSGGVGAHQPIIPGRARAGMTGVLRKTTDAMTTKPMVLNSFNGS